MPVARAMSASRAGPAASEIARNKFPATSTEFTPPFCFVVGFRPAVTGSDDFRRLSKDLDIMFPYTIKLRITRIATQCVAKLFRRLSPRGGARMTSMPSDIDYQSLVFDYKRSSDQDASRPVRHPVVLVGAGRGGDSGAMDLAQEGEQQVLLLDGVDRLSHGSRALCFAKRHL